jgi:hypothetical protein
LGVTSGGVTITAGALAVNSDSITSDGALTINAVDSVVLGGGGNTFTFDESSGPLYAGTARPTKRIVLTPEYAGAVLTGDGTNNSGTMSTDNDTTTSPYRNFYNWTVNGGTVNDYDIWVRVPLPSDFDEFTSSDALTIAAWSDVLGSTTMEIIQVYDNSGAGRCTLAVNIESGSASTWTDKTSDQTCTDTGVASANDIWTVRIRVGSSNADNARVGRFYIEYYAKF